MAPTMTAQPLLPIFDEPVETYTEVERIADRELCQRYLSQWCGAAFAMPGATPVATVVPISRAAFEAAAERLAAE